MAELKANASISIEYHVTEDDLASRISSDPQDSFPGVLATSRMLALMEIASARLMRPLLGSGELSVGVSASISHSAPTIPGALVRVHAEFLGQEAKLYRFKVALYDAAGVAGEGEHTRAIVKAERLIAGARRRGEDGA